MELGPTIISHVHLTNVWLVVGLNRVFTCLSEEQHIQ